MREYLHKINFQMLVDAIEDHYEEFSFRKYRDDLKLEGVLLYYGQKMEQQYVYLGRAETFLQYDLPKTEMSLISIGKLPEEWLRKRSVLILEKNLDPAKVMNQVNLIFQEYFSMFNQLSDCLNRNEGVEAICRIGVQMFRNPLFVHDDKFRYVAYPKYVEGMPKIVHDEKTDERSMSAVGINRLKVNQKYKETLGKKGAHIWDEESARTLYVNIFDEDIYLGRLIINELQSPLKPGYFVLAEYLAEVLKRSMLNTCRIGKKDRPLDMALKKLIAGENVDKKEILSQLGQYGWKQKDTYFCMKVTTTDTSLDRMSLFALTNHMNRQFEHGYAFVKENQVYAVLNLTALRMDEQECRHQMAILIRDGLLKVGASMPFYDALQIGIAFWQADMAIAYGFKEGWNQWYHNFSECVVPYLFGNACRDIPAEMLAAPQLIRLKQIDEERGTDFYLTLKEYLYSGKNIISTAEKLYIHRSTLTYRLGRIQELTELDFSDPQKMLYLILSYGILDNME